MQRRLTSCLGLPAGDMESEKAHLGGVIVRDLSCVVSNYRSTKTLDQYCKEQGVLGARSAHHCAHPAPAVICCLSRVPTSYKKYGRHRV